MSRNATTSPSASRRGQSQWTSHLRQISRTSLERASIDLARSPDTVSSSSTTIRDPLKVERIAEKSCTVSINESVIGDDVLLNLDLIGGGIRPGTLMSITPIKPEQERTSSSLYSSTRPTNTHRSSHLPDDPSRHEGGAGRRYIFVAKDISKELRAKQPNVQIYVAKHIGSAFGMKKGTQVILAPVDDTAPAVEASHVELSFRDMYLSRADMWRLVVADLTDRTVYKGQVVFFLGTIKATVSTVFVDGRKVQSAFFGHNTRPIFRSESARYVLFIQMAREMWDFDSDGSGEIMFYKVVNGFLPALFKKWAMLQVKHLVTIVLFARVEYDTGLTTDLTNSSLLEDYYYTGFQTSGDKRPYKDFYRVVVSEMSSGEWTTILHQLKREFNTFRRDISLHHLEAMSRAMDVPNDDAAGVNASTRVRAESSLAMYGNFLEAINLASSQYAHDYIDRDLLRTGISIVVISPGSGVFEVEYESLRRTTEALVGNGIGIDLICIPKIPLHSVPLFRYRNPHYLEVNQRTQPLSLRSRDGTPKAPTPLVGSYTTLSGSLSPTKVMDSTSKVDPLSRLYTDEWAFALPQWLHVSYWTGKSEEALSYQGISLSAADHSSEGPQDDFTIRCRLYDLQMRSVLETNEIETTPLHADPKYPGRTANTSNSGKPSDHQLPSSQGSRTRKSPEVLFEPVYGFQKFVPDKVTKPGEGSLWKQLQAFDEYRSRLPASRYLMFNSKSTRELDEMTRKQLVEDTGLFGSSVGDKKAQVASLGFSSSFASVSRADPVVPEVPESLRRDSVASAYSKMTSPAKLPKLMRQISLGQKGFGIAAPKAAVAQLRTENVNALHGPHGIPKTPTASRMTPVTAATPSKAPTMPSSPLIVPSGSSFRSPEMAKTDLTEQLQDLVQNTPSRPIHIKPSLSNPDSISQIKSGSILATGSVLVPPTPNGTRPEEDRDFRFSNVLRAEDAQKLYNSKLLAGVMPELPSTLSPTTAMAPWLVVLNPSNPNVNSVDDAVLFSRWQHVFPRPSDMKLMKWKSLSSPASVPLTTEHFPSKAQFDTEYQRQPYTVVQNLEDDLAEEPRSKEDFLRELISARFAHGFQVVIGPSVARAFGQKLLKIADIFSRDRIVEDGTSLFMSIGNTIHQLSCVSGTEVEVNIFVRKPTESFLPADQPQPLYKPAIRCSLEQSYEAREIDIITPKPEKNWNYIDSYIAGQFEEMTEILRFWRTRFVLIPMTSRASSTTKSYVGDDEEEVRLEGIKRLAQAWQRHRFISPSERHFQSAGRKWRDPNPLDIVYKTEDSSVVIAAEMETLPFFENAETSSRKNQLVSNKERFSKSNFKISALVDAIQQPVENGGIRVQNRRWHLRLHYNCFIGSDMTTWLLDTFEDLESREEAVELGNSLMLYEEEKSKDKEKDSLRDAKRDRDRGIFVHVERRHPFRDGQYFYQIASDHGKPQAPGWLNMRRKDASAPSTPIADQPPRDSPRTGLSGMSRPTSIHEEHSPSSGTTTPTLPVTNQGKRPNVVLSKVMKYDVDHRKKSYRPERINLHYDRLHNPDNCYHIRIDWMSVTAKLIEDAVKGWASIAAQHGLRLVEVPIAEACSVTDASPFRRPYHIKLALPPPAQRPVTYYDPNSFAPQTQPGKHYYQKALLRKFDFVLDVEAASNFPSNVDVSYSWGKPDFKYTQYIHRSGMLLAEVTDKGDFLVLPNRLYSNRAVAAQQGHPRTEQPPLNDRVSRLISTGSYTSYGIAEPTPISSPLSKPVTFSTAQSWSAREGHPVGISPRLGAFRPGVIPGHVTGEAESIKDTLEAFCRNEELLEAFYKETLERGAAAGQTPAVSASAETDSVSDAGIPVLGLPPGVLSSAGEMPASPRVGTPTLSGSMMLRRGSVQQL